MLNGRFERIAASAARRIADLLGPSVFVIDEAGAVVTSHEPQTANSLALGQIPPQGQEFAHIPVKFNGWSGTVILGNPPADRPIAVRVAQSLVQLVIEQSYSSAQVQHHDQMRDKFIYDLLRGGWGAEADLRREAELIELDLARPHVAIVINASDYTARSSGKDRSNGKAAGSQERAQEIVRSVMRFFGVLDEVICAYMGGGEVAVLAATDSRLLQSEQPGDTELAPGSWEGTDPLKRMTESLLDYLKTELNCEFKAGVGRYHPGLAGLAHSYRDAHDALMLGLSYVRQGRVYSLDSLGLITFVSEAGEKLKREMADQLLLPLLHEEELLHTLDVYLALDCRVDTSAEQLAVHRNTLRYRLDRIASLTGLDPRNFNQAVELRLARLLQSRDSRPCANAQVKQ
jgi:carbohydrate diacid regulator